MATRPLATLALIATHALLAACSLSAAPRVADVTVRIHQDVVRSQALKDLTKGYLKDFKDLSATCNDGQVDVTGVYDGPAFINPSFTAKLRVSVPKPNTIEVRIHKVRVLGIVPVKSIAYGILQWGGDKLKSATKDKAAGKAIGEIRHEGRDKEDMTYVSTVTVDPAALVPAMASTHLVPDVIGIDIKDGWIEMHLSLPETPPAKHMWPW